MISHHGGCHSLGGRKEGGGGGGEGLNTDLGSGSRPMFVEDAGVVQRLLLGVTQAGNSPCCMPSTSGIIRKNVTALDVLKSTQHHVTQHILRCRCCKLHGMPWEGLSAVTQHSLISALQGSTQASGY